MDDPAALEFISLYNVYLLTSLILIIIIIITLIIIIIIIGDDYTYLY